jgi:PilZ domain
LDETDDATSTTPALMARPGGAVANLRTYERRSSTLPAAMLLIEPEVRLIQVQTINVSIGGVALSSPVPVAVGSTIGLRLHVNNHPIVATVAVRSCSKEAPHMIGGHFHDVLVADEDRLARYVLSQYRRNR